MELVLKTRGRKIHRFESCTLRQFISKKGKVMEIIIYIILCLIIYLSWMEYKFVSNIKKRLEEISKNNKVLIKEVARLRGMEIKEEKQ